jgi:TonB family protein
MADYRNDIDKYLRGELTPAQMNALEKKALDDPFLADALEGIQSLQPHELSDDLKQIQSELNKRLNKKHIGVWIWVGRIAAGLLVLAVSTYVIFLISNRSQQNEKLALNKSSEPTPLPEVRRPAPLLADSILTPEQEITRTDAAAEQAQKQKDALHDQPTRRQQRADEPAVKAPAEPSKPLSESKAEETVAEESLGIAEMSPADDRIAGAETKKEPAPPVTINSDKDAEKGAADDLPKPAREESATGAAARKRANSLNVVRKIVRGKVTFAEDGTALPGVNVLVKDTNQGTVTDAQGNYEIPVEQDNPTLLFSFIGFNSKEAEVTSNEMNVALDTDVSELSEVVVVGYGSTSDASSLPATPPVMELATPEGGRKYFKKYLEDNMRYPERALENNVEGKVTIQFTVGTGGQLSDFRVIRGIGYGCDEEVIRLIKGGPKWSPTKRNDEALKDRVRVRMRFALPKK